LKSELWGAATVQEINYKEKELAIGRDTNTTTTTNNNNVFIIEPL